MTVNLMIGSKYWAFNFWVKMAQFLNQWLPKMGFKRIALHTLPQPLNFGIKILSHDLSSPEFFKIFYYISLTDSV